MQAIGPRPGGQMGSSGQYEVRPPSTVLAIHLHGGRPGARSCRADPADLDANRPGQGIRPHLPLEQAAEGYKAMDERRAIKVLLTL